MYALAISISVTAFAATAGTSTPASIFFCQNFYH
jgi:hypothetical protein